ncbi:MAG: O-antigen ligase family protein, partial [Victivallales bacterium]|nr:O-antigen ligase family protein [Victivallales bacterium]
MAFLPVIYMGGESWWLPLELIIALVGFFCWGLAYWWRGYRAGRFSISPTVLFFALPLAVAVLQCIQSDALASVLSPKAYGLVEDFNALGLAAAKHSISVAPDWTYRYVMLLLVALLFHILAYSHCTERMKMRLMLLAIVLAALGNAGLSFYEFFISGSKASINLPVFKGAFLNRNHFGFLMMLGIMSDLGLLTGILLDEKHSHRRRNSMTSGEEYEWKGWRVLVIPLGIVLFLLLVALLMSFSRGAFTGTVVSLLGFGIIWFTKRPEAEKKNRQLVLAIMVLVSVTLVGAMPYVMDSLSRRFSDVFDKDLSMNARWLIWKDSVRLISDYKLAGVGLGCFRNIIQPYESGNFKYELIDHAHNDFLELGAEIGLPAAVILLLGIVVFLCIVIHRCWKVHDPTYRWCCFALLSAMFGVAIHEFLDFNLHAYPNFLIFSVILSLLAICVHRRGKSMEEITGMTHSELHELNRKQRYGIRLLLLPLSLLSMAALTPYCIRQLQVSIARNTLRMQCESDKGEWTQRPAVYKRRIGLANSVLARYPNDQKTLMYKSNSELRLAMHPSVKREQAVTLIVEACDDIALACSRAPSDGDAAFVCAMAFS